VHLRRHLEKTWLTYAVGGIHLVWGEGVQEMFKNFQLYYDSRILYMNCKALQLCLNPISGYPI
jgi:hypothetical protein